MNLSPSFAHGTVDDPFGEMYSESDGCYHIQVLRNVPTLEIKDKQVLTAKALSPKIGDIVICPGNSNGIYIGKLVRRNGNRLLLLMPSGVIRLIVAATVLVVV
jgi:hypothetical protein